MEKTLKKLISIMLVGVFLLTGCSQKKLEDLHKAISPNNGTTIKTLENNKNLVTNKVVMVGDAFISDIADDVNTRLVFSGFLDSEKIIISDIRHSLSEQSGFTREDSLNVPLMYSLEKGKILTFNHDDYIISILKFDVKGNSITVSVSKK